MNWYLGTMGFGYQDWNGVFYPVGLPGRNYLGHYSRIFNAVEIDSSFYGTPRLETILRWAASSPTEFRFSAKTPQLITHEMGLVNAISEMNAFLEAMHRLGDKLGVILLQFPPSFTVQGLEALAAFLAELPSDVRFAVEFRHQSWYTRSDEIEAVLRQHAICWAATEYPGLPQQIHLTTDFVYIRWIGQHGAYQKHTFERVDKSSDLTRWWQEIRTILPNIHSIFGFFNNDYAGYAPGTCNKFKQIAGLPNQPFQPPIQGKLF